MYIFWFFRQWYSQAYSKIPQKSLLNAISWRQTLLFSRKIRNIICAIPCIFPVSEFFCVIVHQSCAISCMFITNFEFFFAKPLYNSMKNWNTNDFPEKLSKCTSRILNFPRYQLTFITSQTAVQYVVVEGEDEWLSSIVTLKALKNKVSPKFCLLPMLCCCLLRFVNCDLWNYCANCQLLNVATCSETVRQSWSCPATSKTLGRVILDSFLVNWVIISDPTLNNWSVLLWQEKHPVVQILLGSEGRAIRSRRVQPLPVLEDHQPGQVVQLHQVRPPRQMKL